MEVWSNSELIAQWLLSFLLIMVIFTFLLVRLTQRGMKRIIEAREKEHALRLEHEREMLESTIEVQEREKERIAAEVHDSLIGKLVQVQLMSQMKEKENELTPHLQDAIEMARNISHELSPPMVNYASLPELISELSSAFLNYFQINVLLAGNPEYANDPHLKLQVLRISQEWLNNIRKHAQCDSTTIYLRFSAKGMLLIINDNGVGFDTLTQFPGLGIKNIIVRTHALNGKHSIRSIPAKGTRLCLILPVKTLKAHEN